MDNKTTGRKLLLRPASLQKANTNSEQNGSSENGNPSAPVVNNNPFLKCEKDEAEVTQSRSEEKNTATDAEKDPAGATTTTNLFKPANTNLFAAPALSDNSNFVFGQNLHERVVMENVNTQSLDELSGKTGSDEKLSLFAIKPVDTAAGAAATAPENDAVNDENKEETTEDSSTEKESLVEAARKYEEMRGAQKRKYEEVEITTGEEDERNILEINCKLFTFIENNYEERGRGMLRLNDSLNSAHSRVVFRASGSLRVLLNTKVWRGQVCEQPSQKSLRLTAFDTNGLIKIFLVMGRNEDIGQLYRVLSSRILKAKDRSPTPEAPSEKEQDEQHGVEEPANKKTAVANE